MDFVVHKVRQLQHVDVSDGDFLFERQSHHAVEESRFPCFRKIGLLQHVFDFRFRGAVENRRREIHAERMGGPPEMRLENLTNVHS